VKFRVLGDGQHSTSPSEHWAILMLFPRETSAFSVHLA